MLHNLPRSGQLLTVPLPANPPQATHCRAMEDHSYLPHFQAPELFWCLVEPSVPRKTPRNLVPPPHLTASDGSGPHLQGACGKAKACEMRKELQEPGTVPCTKPLPPGCGSISQAWGERLGREAGEVRTLHSLTPKVRCSVARAKG